MLLENFLKSDFGLKETPDHFKNLLIPDALGFPFHRLLLYTLTITSLFPFVKPKKSSFRNPTIFSTPPVRSLDFEIFSRLLKGHSGSVAILTF
jgi:hypothetical protein